MALIVVASCSPETMQPKGLNDPWFNEDENAPPTVTGNLDEAEMRWRKDIEAHQGVRNADDPNALLTDDPPAAPDAYGNVADPGNTPQPPATFSDKANAFGRASFAAMSVAVTLGMMVAPYFLF